MRPLLLLLLTLPATAQWQLQQSHTTASLRGIHSLGNGIAWASGTEGTVLHTTDGGTTWQTCTIPPAAEKLDFRGIQAFDAQTAIVMSSGKGDLSRLYKTTNACNIWKLVFTNPDPEGFFDAIFHDDQFNQTFVLGDPVKGRFQLFVQRADNRAFTPYGGATNLHAAVNQAAFAASNSVLIRGGRVRLRKLCDRWINVGVHLRDAWSGSPAGAG